MSKVIPDGWHSTKIKKIIAAIESGVSANGETECASENELGVLKVSAVTSGRFDAAQNKRVTSETERQRLKCPVSANSIVMTRSNGSIDLVGACVFVNEDHPNLFLSDKLWKLVLTDEGRDESRWLYYLLCSSPLRQRIIGSSSGSVGMRNLSKSELLGITVGRPPFPEQQKIATILSTWDRAIELTEKLIAAKQRRKRAIMQQLLTGKVRFAEFGEPATKSETIPAGWKTTKVSDVASVTFSNVDKKVYEDQETVLLCNYMDVYRNTHITSDISFMESTATDREITRFSLHKGDVLFTKDSETPDDIANAAIVIHDLPGVVCGYHLGILRPNSACDGSFLGQLLMLPRIRYEFSRIANGVTRYGLGLDSTKSIPIWLPESLKEQQRIAEVLFEADREIDMLRSIPRHLGVQKKGLMQQLLTGKVRVENDMMTDEGGVSNA